MKVKIIFVYALWHKAFSHTETVNKANIYSKSSPSVMDVVVSVHLCKFFTSLHFAVDFAVCLPNASYDIAII